MKKMYHIYVDGMLYAGYLDSMVTFSKIYRRLCNSGCVIKNVANERKEIMKCYMCTKGTDKHLYIDEVAPGRDKLLYRD